MKSILLLIIACTTALCAMAQSTTLPPGRYETILKQSQDKWKQGDIILIDDSHYKMSSGNDIGEYRFSTAAQRIFFVSGPLKTVFAKAILNADKPTIVLPASENEQQGLKLAAVDVIGYLKN